MTTVVVVCDSCGERTARFFSTRINFPAHPGPRRPSLDLCPGCTLGALAGLKLPDPEPADAASKTGTKPVRTESHQAVIIKPSRLNGTSHQATFPAHSND
jgi:hypothetical protein